MEAKNLILILISAIIVISLLYVAFFKKQRHHYKIKQGEKILTKIRSFEGDNVNDRIINYLRKINPFTFEEMLLSLFNESGCKIKRNKKYTGDGGLDGKFKFKGKWYFIQAKRYSNYIKSTDVEALAVLCRKKKVKGLFIHTGKAGKGSLEIEKKNDNIMIITPEDLVQFIKTGKLKIDFD